MQKKVPPLGSGCQLAAGYLVEGAFETDGGIVIDEASMAGEEDFVEFGF